MKFALLLFLCGCDNPPATHFPVLKQHSSAVLSPLRLVTVVAQNETFAAELNAFGDALVTSAWWKAGAPFGLTTATSEHYTGPAPDGVKINGPLPFTAYHAPFGTRGDGWAVVSRAKPFGGGETQLQELTYTGSHELIEAASDPTWMSWSLDAPPKQPWTASVWQVMQVPGPIETADLCEGSRLIDGFEYQRFFSNQAALAGGDPCVPAVSGTYFNTSAEKEWTTASSIDVTGWATAPTGDWLVIADVIQSSGGFSALNGKLLPVSSALGQEQKPCLGVGINVGTRVTIDVTPPAQAVSGDWAVVRVQSFRVNPATCFPDPHGDQLHFTLVGVYLP